MLGKTNAAASSGGGSDDKIYGVRQAYEYIQNLRDGSVIKAGAACLNILDRAGSPVKLSGRWTYKPTDLGEYMQDVLTGDNTAACVILGHVIRKATS